MSSIQPILPDIWAELRIVAALLALLLLPGTALLYTTGYMRERPLLERLIVATGVSIALLPVLFYALRFWFPQWRHGATPVWWLLILSLLATIVHILHSQTPERFSVAPVEFLALFVFGITLLSRLWMAHVYPIPAWTDSLHHALITRLTAEQGQLATSLAPYFPIPLDMYHLGLYAIASSVQWLSGTSPHVALQWSAQTLNGLCGLGVYYVLAPRMGRFSGVTGALVVGLLSHQPAYYVNWGRYTQVASQTIILIAWGVLLQHFERLEHLSRRERSDYLRQWIVATLVASLLSAAIFLLHFRVAALYLLLLICTLPLALGQAIRAKKVSLLIGFLSGIALFSLLFIGPALSRALLTYSSLGEGRAVITNPDQVQQAVRSYYVFPLVSVPLLVARPWLLSVAVLSSLVGLWRRNWMVALCLVWIATMLGLGNAYMLDVSLLKITNLGAVLIMLYLPIGVIIGAATGELYRFPQERMRRNRSHSAPRLGFARAVHLGLFLGVVGLGLFGLQQRVNDTEPWRFFVRESDLAAMAWVEQNTPPESRFGINTSFWLPGTPHGVDAGYWIPYFTGRKTNGGVMLMVLAPFEYRVEVLEQSRAVVDLAANAATKEQLRALGIDYIFLGAVGGADPHALQLEGLRQKEGVTLVYENGESAILKLD